MDIFRQLTSYVSRVFKTSLEVFLEALKRSPNAQGYVRGSVTELLLQRELEDKWDIELKRIREKWEGRKLPGHHGDFYFRRRRAACWYVLESKGVKSNAEKWHKLYNYANLKSFLLTNSDKIPWLVAGANEEEQIVAWLRDQLPKFETVYSAPLYQYEEVQKYRPTRDNVKARAIAGLRSYSREHLNQMLDARLAYLATKLKVLETHFVSGTSGVGARTQATPRKDEFNVVAVDIVLKYDEHKFLFANPQNLESSGADVDHLQQNYVMGFVFTEAEGEPSLSVTEDWTEDFNEVLESVDPKHCVQDSDMQIDNRYAVYGEDPEDVEDAEEGY